MSKTGRPKAERPKDIKYSIRIDGETERELEAYCLAANISKGEAFRKGIKLLLRKGQNKSE